MDDILLSVHVMDKLLRQAQLGVFRLADVLLRPDAMPRLGSCDPNHLLTCSIAACVQDSMRGH